MDSAQDGQDKSNSQNSNADKIKQSAMKLFSKYGYGAATVRMIAEDAGLSAGQIAAHYGSKEELFNSIANDIIESMSGDFDPIVDEANRLLESGNADPDSALELIERIIDIQMDFCLDNNHRSWIMMMYILIPNSPYVEDANKQLLKNIRYKIEITMAELIQVYTQERGYLRARTLSRAINGAIVSFSEHEAFLMDEVYHSQYYPNSVKWMRGYLKDFIMKGLESARTAELRE